MRYLRLALLPLVFGACTEQDPAAPEMSPLFKAQAPHKLPISGVMTFVGAESPADVHATPGGICHYADWPFYFSLEGDVQGEEVVHETWHRRCDFTVEPARLVAHGPFEANVTWNGRTGTISGMWTTNCEVDPSQPAGVYCSGTRNARGSGGLAGVHFHFKWGQTSGWSPWDYTGTVYY